MRGRATNVRIEHPIHRRGEPLPPPPPGGLTHSLEASRRIGPALCPDVVTVGRVLLGPPASLDHLRSRYPDVVRRRPRYYQAVRLLAVVHHRHASIDFPMRPAALPAAVDHEISRFPNAVLPCVRGVSDRAGFPRASRWRHAGCGLPLLPTASALRSCHECHGSIPGPPVPLSTLRQRSHTPPYDSGPLRFARPSTCRTCIYCTAPVSRALGKFMRWRRSPKRGSERRGSNLGCPADAPVFKDTMAKRGPSVDNAGARVHLVSSLRRFAK